MGVNFSCNSPTTCVDVSPTLSNGVTRVSPILKFYYIRLFSPLFEVLKTIMRTRISTCAHAALVPVRTRITTCAHAH